jgi:hypothetical protein
MEMVLAINNLEKQLETKDGMTIRMVQWDEIRYRGVVLCEMVMFEGTEKEYRKYVTWVFNALGETFWGEYFETFNNVHAHKDAVGSFVLRSRS